MVVHSSCGSEQRTIEVAEALPAMSDSGFFACKLGTRFKRVDELTVPRAWLDYVEDILKFEYSKQPFFVENLLRRATLDRVVEEGLAKGVVVNREIAQHNERALEERGYEQLRRLFEERLVGKGQTSK